MIKVLLVKPNDVPRVMEIEDELETYQNLVEGYIECIYPFGDDNVCIVCNDEGKLKGLAPNRFIKGDLIVGNFVIVAYQNGDFISLTDKQITTYKKLFGSRSFI